jgi:F0F1-type ATP synthase membrane subunit c/vacuolar-type H+-ATPase subunit K
MAKTDCQKDGGPMNKLVNFLREVVLVLLLAGLAVGLSLLFSTAGQEATAPATLPAAVEAPAFQSPIQMTTPIPTQELVFQSPIQPPTATPPVPEGTPWLYFGPELGPTVTPRVPVPPVEPVTYTSRTLIVAQAGDGPGEIGIVEGPGYEPPAGPLNVAVDGAGSVYILDRMNHRVAKYDDQGHFLFNIPYGDHVSGIDMCVDDQGSVFVYDFETQVVKMYDVEGHHVRDHPKPAWMEAITNIECSKEGYLLVEGDGWPPSVTPSEQEEGLGSYTTVAAGTRDEIFDEERQLATLKFGGLYQGGVFFPDLAPDKQSLLVWDHNADLVASLPLPSDPLWPYFGVGPNGYMYVGLATKEAVANGQCQLMVFDPYGRRVGTLTMPAYSYTSRLSNAGIVFDSRSNVYRLRTLPDQTEVIRWERQ